MFLRLHDLLLDRQAEVLDLVQLETGKARRHALEELVDVALTARHYARSARRYLAPVRHAGLVPVLSSAHELRHPKGVVGIVSPWNYPLTLAVTDAIPAFLAGNAVVHKPDTQTALTALWIRALADRGRPARATSGRSSSATVRWSAARSSTAVTSSASPARRRWAGRSRERCARRLVGCSLELGGKNPMLVLGDADLDRAAEGAVRDCFSNAGQLCISMERIYAVESVHDAFLDRFLGRVRAMRLGSDLGYGPDMGSLISARPAGAGHGARRGRRRQGRARCSPAAGPGRTSGRTSTSRRCSPASREDMALCRDETFGPVVSVTRGARHRRGGRAWPTTRSSGSTRRSGPATSVAADGSRRASAPGR